MDTSSVTAVGRETAGAGQVLADIGDTMIKAQALQEHTEANNKATTATRELILKAKQDPDYRNSDKYIQELSAIKADASKGLTLRKSKADFDTDFATLSNAALLDIKQDSRTKMVNKGIADLNMALDQNQDLYVAEGNPIRQAQIMKRMDSLIDAHIQRGYITPESGYKLKQSRIENLGVKKFYGDLSAITTSAQADAMLKGLQEGHYEQNGVTIDPQKKESMYNTIEKYKAKLETEQVKAMKVTQNKNETEWSVAISRGEANKLGGLNGLQEAALRGDIDTATFERLEKAMTSTEKAPASQKSAAFVKVNEDFYSLKLDDDGIAEGNSIDQLRRFRNGVIEEYNAGRLDAADFQAFIQKTTPDYLKAQAPKFDYIRAGLDLVKKAAMSMFGGSAAMSAQMARDFVVRADQAPAEEVSEEAAAVVREARVKADPELSLVNEKSGGTADKNGIARRTYQPKTETKQLSVGDVYTNKKGQQAVVVGLDKDGTPLLEPMKTPEKKGKNADQT